MATNRLNQFSQHPFETAARQPSIDTTAHDVDVMILCEATAENLDRYHEMGPAVVKIIRELRGLSRRPKIGFISYSGSADTNAEPVEMPLTRRFGELKNFLDQHQEFGCLSRGQSLEQALHCANEQVWRPQAKKAVIIIGENPPHGVATPSYKFCPANHDFRDEIEGLARQQVQVFSVVLGQRLETQRAFEWMSAETRGASINTAKSAEFHQLVTAIAHRICGEFRSYTRKIRSTGRVTEKFKALLAELAA